MATEAAMGGYLFAHSPETGCLTVMLPKYMKTRGHPAFAVHDV